MKTTIPRNSIPSLLLIPLVFVCFGLSPEARAVFPAPDGGYPNDNTAEGEDALFSLTTGHDNTAIGFHALYSNTTGSNNTASGSFALTDNTTGFNNTANGVSALFGNTTGGSNTASGSFALTDNTTGVNNTANGVFALFLNTTGNGNTANGVQALSNTTGNNNIALGFGAGSNLTTGDNNIDIGNQGVAAEANTIRIGKQGTQRATFIAGIIGVPIAGPTVHISGTGQLGIGPPSSARFKQNVKPMDRASEAILALKPVTFHYKKELDPEGIPQFGLVAEEVEKVNPDLVARDAKGEVYTVRYEAVNAMLLNEFLKEHRTVAELKKEIAALTATVKEQAAQIQKVSAHFEVSKPAPQIVVNDQ